MTTLIGCRCKSGNIFSRALLIGRGLFLIEICLQISKGYLDCEVYILCNFQCTSWKPRIIGRQQTKVCWWPSERKPPVPIPNTVVKTLSGENTWRATSWEDNSLPTSKLNKSEITWTSSFAFSFENIYPLKAFNLSLFLRKPPASRYSCRVHRFDTPFNIKIPEWNFLRT